MCAASPKISRIPLAPDPSRLSSRATCQPHPTTKSLHRHSYKMRTAAKTAPQSRENLPPARHCEIAISHPSRSLKSPSPPRADSLLTTNNQLAMSTPTIANANSDYFVSGFLADAAELVRWPPGQGARLAREHPQGPGQPHSVAVNYVKGGGWRFASLRRRPKCIERSIALDARRLGACHASCAAARAEAAGVPPPSRTLALHHPPPPARGGPRHRLAAWCGHVYPAIEPSTRETW